MSECLYPLLFQPVGHATPWAGNRLERHRQAAAGTLTPPENSQGECWELVDAGPLQTCVSNGPLAGKSLGELVRQYPADMVSRRHKAGQPFPLCVRLLNVGRNLPLYVHPDESMCAEHSDMQLNTKFWYCLDAAPDAEITVSIGQRVARTQVLQNLNTDGLRDLLQRYPACPGDSYLIPSGRVHAAGADTLMLEVMQCAMPPLHVSGWAPNEAPPAAEQELAIEAVHFEDRQVPRICREAAIAAHTRRIPLVRHCPFFFIEEIRITDHFSDRADGQSFHILAVVSNTVCLVTDNGDRLELPTGSICFLPARLGGYRLEVPQPQAAVVRIRLQA